MLKTCKGSHNALIQSPARTHTLTHLQTTLSVSSLFPLEASKVKRCKVPEKMSHIFTRPGASRSDMWLKPLRDSSKIYNLVLGGNAQTLTKFGQMWWCQWKISRIKINMKPTWKLNCLFKSHTAFFLFFFPDTLPHTHFQKKKKERKQTSPKSKNTHSEHAVDKPWKVVKTLR